MSNQLQQIMNIENLEKTYPNLLTFMKANGYAERYICLIKANIKRVLSECSDPSILSYEDYAQMLQCKFSGNQLRQILNALSVIRQFDLYSQYPDSSRHYGFVRRNNKYFKLGSEFQRLIDDFLSKNTYTERNEYNHKLTMVNFLYYLQEKGYTSLDDVDEKDILSFFFDDGKEIHGVNTLNRIKHVLCIQPEEKATQYAVFISKLSKIVAHRKCYPVLSQEEVLKIKDALETNNHDISLREKAITILALRTGIRACDISKLSFNNIDWEKDRIAFTQSKTGIEVVLPLLPDVGNAIFDYVIKERPKSELPFLFLTKTRIPRMLQPGPISLIAARFMAKAGVRVTGGRKGTHLYRHNLAISLLNNNVPSPVIMKVLGQTSADSMNGYLESDFDRLKACALSIDSFSKYWKEVLL